MLEGANSLPTALALNPDNAAPLLWRNDLRHMVAGHVGRQDMPPEPAAALQREAESLPAGGGFDMASDPVPGLVRHSHCSAQDFEFTALAMKPGSQRVTIEQTLLRACPQCAVARVDC